MSVLNTFWHGCLTILNNPDLQCIMLCFLLKFILEDAKDQRITWKEGIQSVSLKSVSLSVIQPISHLASQSVSHLVSH